MLKRTKFTIGAAAVLALAGGSVAYASIPDASDGNFHACTVTNSGQTLKPVYSYDAEDGTYTSCPTGYTETELKVGGGVYAASTNDSFDSNVDLPEYEGSGAFIIPGDGTKRIIVAKCPEGTAGFSGGFDTSSGGPTEITPVRVLQSSRRNSDWRFNLVNESTVDETVTLHAFCTEVHPYE